MPRRRPPDRVTCLGRRLLEAREACGLRQVDVAAATGRSRPVVSRWEAGEIEPDVADLAVLGPLLKTPIEALLRAAEPGGRTRSRRAPGGPGTGVGQLIARTRRATEMDVVQLAKRAHLSARRLARIEAGATPSLAEVDRLLRVLEVEPAAVAGRFAKP